MKVRTNADTPADAKKAVVSLVQKVLVFAVQSICSSVRDRIDAFREMICSTTAEEREAALAKVLPYQQEDFKRSVRGSGG